MSVPQWNPRLLESILHRRMDAIEEDDDNAKQSVTSKNSEQTSVTNDNDTEPQPHEHPNGHSAYEQTMRHDRVDAIDTKTDFVLEGKEFVSLFGNSGHEQGLIPDVVSCMSPETENEHIVCSDVPCRRAVIEFQAADGLKQIVAAMEGVCKNITFDCSLDRVQVRGMDCTRVALISVLMKSSVVLHVYCPCFSVFCVSIKSLLKVLRMCPDSAALTITYNEKSVLDIESDDRVHLRRFKASLYFLDIKIEIRNSRPALYINWRHSSNRTSSHLSPP